MLDRRIQRIDPHFEISLVGAWIERLAVAGDLSLARAPSNIESGIHSPRQMMINTQLPHDDHACFIGQGSIVLHGGRTWTAGSNINAAILDRSRRAPAARAAGRHGPHPSLQRAATPTDRLRFENVTPVGVCR